MVVQADAIKCTGTDAVWRLDAAENQVLDSFSAQFKQMQCKQTWVSCHQHMPQVRDLICLSWLTKDAGTILPWQKDGMTAKLPGCHYSSPPGELLASMLRIAVPVHPPAQNTIKRRVEESTEAFLHNDCFRLQWLELCHNLCAGRAGDSRSLAVLVQMLASVFDVHPCTAQLHGAVMSTVTEISKGCRLAHEEALMSTGKFSPHHLDHVPG